MGFFFPLSSVFYVMYLFFLITCHHLFPPEQLESLHSPLPIPGPRSGPQLTQKKARVQTMVSTLQLLLTLSLIPICSFSSSLADLLATSLDTLHVLPPRGFSFTIHSSWNLSLPEICRLTPLFLHVFIQMSPLVGWGGGLWSSHLKFPLPHTPYPPT